MKIQMYYSPVYALNFVYYSIVQSVNNRKTREIQIGRNFYQEIQEISFKSKFFSRDGLDCFSPLGPGRVITLCHEPLSPKILWVLSCYKGLEFSKPIAYVVDVRNTENTDKILLMYLLACLCLI